MTGFASDFEMGLFCNIIFGRYYQNPYAFFVFHKRLDIKHFVHLSVCCAMLDQVHLLPHLDNRVGVPERGMRNGTGEGEGKERFSGAICPEAKGGVCCF
jgi:hypothetical protein